VFTELKILPLVRLEGESVPSYFHDAEGLNIPFLRNSYCGCVDEFSGFNRRRVTPFVGVLMNSLVSIGVGLLHLWVC